MNISKRLFFILLCLSFFTCGSTDNLIKGDKVDWDKMDKIYFDKKDKTVEEYGEVWDDTDNKIKFSVSWDKKNLYFYADIIDNDIYTDVDEEMYLNDCIAIYIYPREQKDAGMKWFFSPETKNKGPVQGKASLHDDVMIIQPDKIKVESTINKNGYTMYITIPVEEIQISGPEAGKTIRFTILNTDADKDNKWGQIMWVGTGDEWDEFSILEFLEDGKVSFSAPDKKAIKN